MRGLLKNNKKIFKNIFIEANEYNILILYFNDTQLGNFKGYFWVFKISDIIKELFESEAFKFF